MNIIGLCILYHTFRAVIDHTMTIKMTLWQSCVSSFILYSTHTYTDMWVQKYTSALGWYSSTPTFLIHGLQLNTDATCVRFILSKSFPVKELVFYEVQVKAAWESRRDVTRSRGFSQLREELTPTTEKWTRKPRLLNWPTARSVGWSAVLTLEATQHINTGFVFVI